ncbi:hypothetical protein D3C79_965730 [compost metagenome]
MVRMNCNRPLFSPPSNSHAGPCATPRPAVAAALTASGELTLSLPVTGMSTSLNRQVAPDDSKV